MNDLERYERVDLPFYRDEIAPHLPPEVLDFHTHTWLAEHWKGVPWETQAAGSKYMVTFEDYGIESLISDGRMLFPEHPYNAVCFGNPTPIADLQKTNAYSAQAGRFRGLYPLLITGRDILSQNGMQQTIVSQGFFGFKVLLSWMGDDYGSVAIDEMIGPSEMGLADKLNLVVLLHVPRTGRLADPEVQAGVRKLSESHPGASIVLAHCGRAYLPDEMMKSIASVRDLPNVYMDTSMVMDPTVLQIVFENIASDRVLFGTDLPVARMRGRRVYTMDHWVDLVLDGYPPSAYRVASDNIRATFMAYEIILAIRRAGEMAGLSKDQIEGVFYGNGMALLARVMGGKQLASARERTT